MRRIHSWKSVQPVPSVHRHTSRHTDSVCGFFFFKYFFRLHFNPFKFILLLQSQVASTTLNKLGVGLCAAAAAATPREWHEKATTKKLKNMIRTHITRKIYGRLFFFSSQPVFNAPYRTRWWKVAGFGHSNFFARHKGDWTFGVGGGINRIYVDFFFSLRASSIHSDRIVSTLKNDLLQIGSRVKFKAHSPCPNVLRYEQDWKWCRRIHSRHQRNLNLKHL